MKKQLHLISFGIALLVSSCASVRYESSQEEALHVALSHHIASCPTSSSLAHALPYVAEPLASTLRAVFSDLSLAMEENCQGAECQLEEWVSFASEWSVQDGNCYVHVVHREGGISQGHHLILSKISGFWKAVEDKPGSEFMTVIGCDFEIDEIEIDEEF